MTEDKQLVICISIQWWKIFDLKCILYLNFNDDCIIVNLFKKKILFIRKLDKLEDNEQARRKY